MNAPVTLSETPENLPATEASKEVYTIPLTYSGITYFFVHTTPSPDNLLWEMKAPLYVWDLLYIRTHSSFVDLHTSADVQGLPECTFLTVSCKDLIQDFLTDIPISGINHYNTKLTTRELLSFGFKPIKDSYERVDLTQFHPALTPIEGHDLCISKTDKTLLCYYQTHEKASKLIRTPIKAGKYITQNYLDFAKADPQAFNLLLQKVAAHFNPIFEIKFATTPEDVQRVYEKGPRSCMSGTDWLIHPSIVYADNPDLQVAYIEDASKNITGRAVVWPEKKIRSRIYGDADRMLPLFKALGYLNCDTDIGFSGARLRKIHNPNNSDDYIMPYIDMCGGRLTDCPIEPSKFFLLTDNWRKSNYNSAREISGTLSGANQDGGTETVEFTCDRTGRTYIFEDQDECDENTYYMDCLNETWHSDAWESDTIRCEFTGEYYPSEMCEDYVYDVNGFTHYACTKAIEERCWYDEHMNQWVEDGLAQYPLLGVSGEIFQTYTLSTSDHNQPLVRIEEGMPIFDEDLNEGEPYYMFETDYQRKLAEYEDANPLLSVFTLIDQPPTPSKTLQANQEAA